MGAGRRYTLYLSFLQVTFLLVRTPLFRIRIFFSGYVARILSVFVHTAQLCVAGQQTLHKGSWNLFVLPRVKWINYPFTKWLLYHMMTWVKTHGDINTTISWWKNLVTIQKYTHTWTSHLIWGNSHPHNNFKVFNNLNH